MIIESEKQKILKFKPVLSFNLYIYIPLYRHNNEIILSEENKMHHGN